MNYNPNKKEKPSDSDSNSHSYKSSYHYSQDSNYRSSELGDQIYLDYSYFISQAHINAIIAFNPYALPKDIQKSGSDFKKLLEKEITRKIQTIKPKGDQIFLFHFFWI